MDNNFELRYLVKSIPWRGYENTGTYKNILQYRTRRAVGSDWSDWMDVPVVESN